MDRRQFLKTAGAGAGVLAGGGILAACGDDDDTAGGTGTGSGTGTSTTAKNLPTTLTLAQAGAVQGLDPIGPSQVYVVSLQAFNACADQLVNFFVPATLEEYDAQDRKEIYPALAESWEESEDRRTIRFLLRKGVTSPFGNEMTADDVMYTLERCISGEGSAASQLAAIGVTFDNWKKIDDYTVEVSTELQQYRLLNVLGLYWYGILDSTEMKKHATASDEWSKEWAAENVAGFGPYTIESFRRSGAEVTFKLRDDYWGEKGMVPTVVYRAVDDPSARLQLLINGEAHYTEDLSPLQLETVAKSDSAKVENMLSTDGCRIFVGWDAPFDDVEVRQAIAKALPYEDVMKSVYRGLPGLQQQKSLVPVFAEGYTEEFGYDRDVEAARSVISAKANGAKLEFVYDGDSDKDRQLAILVQSALNDAGLSVSLKALPHAQFQTEVRAKKWPTSINTTDAPSLVNPIYTLYTACTEAGTSNFTKYKNDEMEQLVKDLNDAPFSDKVPELIRRGQEIAMRDLPVFPMVWSGDQRGVAKSLTILGGHGATGVAYFKDMRFE